MDPVIAVSMGDPAGGGPEILLKAFAAGELPGRLIVAGDASVLRFAARKLGVSADIAVINDVAEIAPGRVNLLDCGGIQSEEDFEPGKLSRTAGDAAWRYIEKAASLALDGKVHAMVTLPVNKEAVQLGHPGFTGHTEMIAEMCGQDDYTMMLASERLTVTHVSTHVSMLEAVRAVTAPRVLRVIQLTRNALKPGREEPRIAVAGLNAHAGEHGLFGREEIEHIVPAIKRANEEGICASGPYPPDTVFLRAANGEFDAVVCMYHDQGHIPIKLLDFDGGVNITLGLKIIRTSVDHGTAFDIAYKGVAKTGSFARAYAMARQMAGV